MNAYIMDFFFVLCIDLVSELMQELSYALSRITLTLY